MPPSRKSPHTFGATPTVIGLLAVGAILYFARAVLIPLALAALIAFVLTPLASRLERRRIPRQLAALIVSSLAAIAVVGTGWVVVSQSTGLVESLPTYRETLQEKIYSIRSVFTSTVDRASGMLDAIEETADAEASSRGADAEPVRVTVVEALDAPFVGRLVWPILAPIATLIMVMVFAAFMLFERDQIREKAIALLNRKHLTVTSHAIDEVSMRVGRYLRVQILLNAANGVITSLTLLLLGVPNALLWGILGAVLRFIPYVGPLIGAVLPIAVSIVISDSWTLPIIVTSFYVVLELIGNVAEPLVQRSSTGVTSLGLLIAAAFWAWIWGIPGLLLSTPMTVCLVVAGSHARSLRWLHVLMADHSPLTPAQRLYRSLITGETASMPSQSPTEPTAVFADEADSLLLPALATARRDLERGDLTEEVFRSTIAGVRALVDARLPSVQPNSSVHPPVLCVPAFDDADAAAAHTLAVAFQTAGIPALALSVSDLGSPIASFIERTGAAHICIVSLPPYALSRARMRIRQVRMRVPDVTISVLLTAPASLEPSILSELTLAGAARVHTSIVQAAQSSWAPAASPDSIESSSAAPIA